jgi:drug/metabolite transporter (DMT)-like permease
VSLRLDPSERRGLLYVVAAVAMFATTPVLIRMADPVAPADITFWRMAIAALTVFVLSIAMRQPVRLPRAELGRFAAFGLVAALHFFLYIASLSFTTIAHSLSLVYTAPIFIAVLSAVFLKEPLARRKYAGIAVTVVGIVILAGFEPLMSPRMFFGDLLALGSAVCFAVYSVIGRSQRGRYPLLSYAFLVYAAAALWLLPPAIAAFKPVYTRTAIVGIVLLGVFPLGIGHTLYNAAVRRVHAAYANLIATQEVTGGILLGWLILGEVPSVNALVGAGISLLGVMMVLL